MKRINYVIGHLLVYVFSSPDTLSENKLFMVLLNGLNKSMALEMFCLRIMSETKKYFRCCSKWRSLTQTKKCCAFPKSRTKNKHAVTNKVFTYFGAICEKFSSPAIYATACLYNKFSGFILHIRSPINRDVTVVVRDSGSKQPLSRLCRAQPPRIINETRGRSAPRTVPALTVSWRSSREVLVEAGTADLRHFRGTAHTPSPAHWRSVSSNGEPRRKITNRKDVFWRTYFYWQWTFLPDGARLGG